jgi:peroxiredoxin
VLALDEPRPATMLKLGQPAPDFTLLDSSGAHRALSDFRGKSNVVLLFTDKTRPKPQSLQKSAANLASLDTALLLVPRPAVNLSQLKSPNLYILSDPGGDVTRRYLVTEPGRVSQTAFLIDKVGLVRRIGCTDALGETRQELVQFVEQWRDGKEMFDLACARCHTDESYPYIKMLGGIGNRLTKGQIRERISAIELKRDQISVRSRMYTRRQLDALLVYVAGL